MTDRAFGRRLALLVLSLAPLLTACESADKPGGAGVAAPPAITPAARLTVERGTTACVVRRHPGAGIPTVRGYRLATAAPLPDGLLPAVKSVRFTGSDDARLLETELCFTAAAETAAGPYDAQIELRLYNADVERLAVNNRLQPLRTIPFTQPLDVR